MIDYLVEECVWFGYWFGVDGVGGEVGGDEWLVGWVGRGDVLYLCLIIFFYLWIDGRGRFFGWGEFFEGGWDMFLLESRKKYFIYLIIDLIIFLVWKYYYLIVEL